MPWYVKSGATKNCSGRAAAEEVEAKRQSAKAQHRKELQDPLLEMRSHLKTKRKREEMAGAAPRNEVSQLHGVHLLCYVYIIGGFGTLVCGEYSTYTIGVLLNLSGKILQPAFLNLSSSFIIVIMNAQLKRSSLCFCGKTFRGTYIHGWY